MLFNEILIFGFFSICCDVLVCISWNAIFINNIQLYSDSFFISYGQNFRLHKFDANRLAMNEWMNEFKLGWSMTIWLNNNWLLRCWFFRLIQMIHQFWWLLCEWLMNLTMRKNLQSRDFEWFKYTCYSLDPESKFI